MNFRIDINQDLACSRCHKPGVVLQNPAGLCLACIVKLANKKLKTPPKHKPEKGKDETHR